ncbi:hypothetical protein SAMN05421803_13720 [Nocardiopsis flavescens]|uniref:Lipoprotein n=1 Tax=Nocardiopsis flavescens TaxID=758803 RepID=A0A1M6VTY5_9ACTN|nr:hypothetical protein [Nocardiopsis flavescens]SHK84907.1 hypothetical protein SAMN05421803_13720 [Nocardiopsis flavescens]
MRTTFLRCSAVAAVVLPLMACGAVGTPEEPAEPVERTVVTLSWVKREVSVLTLERMFAETGSEEVLGNTDELSVERLLESGAARPVEGGEGHEVVLDKAEWRTDEAVNGLRRLDGALGGVMWANEVSWCGEAVDGETFVNAYTEEFTKAFDTHEEYEASIADYVDCGEGRP